MEVAIQAARASGRIQTRNLARTLRIATKGEHTNLVSEVDLRCERRIIDIIHKNFPDHGIYAEEGGKYNTGSPYSWIIDPLDGTTNYTHGYPIFCTSIALEEKGKVILGVVYDPARKELFTARKGRGAYMNGKRLSPSRTSELAEALLVTGFPYDFPTTQENLRHFINFSLRAQAVRRDGSAALDLCYTAMGRFDGFWEYSLAPWDLAAGALVLQEAGGKITLASGRSFSIYRGNVLASNGRIHSAMLRILKMNHN
jgi:myo-inositol-1(or 4)-monophosphatase